MERTVPLPNKLVYLCVSLTFLISFQFIACKIEHYDLLALEWSGSLSLSDCYKLPFTTWQTRKKKKIANRHNEIARKANKSCNVISFQGVFKLNRQFSSPVPIDGVLLILSHANYSFFFLPPFHSINFACIFFYSTETGNDSYFSPAYKVGSTIIFPKVSRQLDIGIARETSSATMATISNVAIVSVDWNRRKKWCTGVCANEIECVCAYVFSQIRSIHSTSFSGLMKSTFYVYVRERETIIVCVPRKTKYISFPDFTKQKHKSRSCKTTRAHKKISCEMHWIRFVCSFKNKNSNWGCFETE